MKPARQIDTLTILRGVAALAVLLQHCYITSRTSYFGETAIVPPPFRWFDYGTDGERFATRRWWQLAVMQGTISYSLYLCHNLALLLGYVVIVSVGLVGWFRLGFVYAVCVPLAYVLAWYSYTWVERPGIEFGRRLRLGPKREVAPTTVSN